MGYFSPADGSFSASRNFDNGVTVQFNGGSGNLWSLNFSAPNDVDLATGNFPGATRWPFQDATEPGLSVTGQGRGCNTLTGEFDVQQADYNPDGSVDAFSATFEQHCEGVAPALYGTIQVNASAASGQGVLENDSDADERAESLQG